MRTVSVPLLLVATLIGGCRTPIDIGDPSGDVTSVEDPPPDLALPFVCRDIYVVDGTSGMLSRFDPREATFSDIDVLRCPGALGHPQTMSVALDGTGWVFFTDYTAGHQQLFQVDLRTAACSATSFDGYQIATDGEFGSSFSLDAPGGASETLFLALPADGALATVDQRTLRVTRVAPLAAAVAELTGTGAAELWGLFPTAAGSTVHRVDKATGALDARIDLPLDLYGGGGFAMAFWGGWFWIFLAGNNGDTAVHQVDPQGSFRTVLANTGRDIVGAGVATCAPLGLDH
jgi:hypothetical protein